MRWNVLDEIIRIEKGKCAVSSSHVPSAPVSPELLFTEMMAQTAGLLLGAETHFQEDVVFIKIHQAQFYPPFEAGRSLCVKAYADQIKPEGAWFEASVSLNGDSRGIAQARLLLMNIGRITAHSPEGSKEAPLPEGEGPVTFHRNFMEHYRIHEKLLT